MKMWKDHNTNQIKSDKYFTQTANTVLNKGYKVNFAFFHVHAYIYLLGTLNKI